jgi:hypothetical protein
LVILPIAKCKKFCYSIATKEINTSYIKEAAKVRLKEIFQRYDYPAEDNK